MLRLYGVLNAVDCQKTSIITLSKLLGNHESNDFLDLEILELRTIVTHLTNVTDGSRRAYHLAFEIRENSVTTVEHTDRSNVQNYNLIACLNEYEVEALSVYERLLNLIIQNLSQNDIIITI